MVASMMSLRQAFACHKLIVYPLLSKNGVKTKEHSLGLSLPEHVPYNRYPQSEHSISIATVKSINIIIFSNSYYMMCGQLLKLETNQLLNCSVLFSSVISCTHWELNPFDSTTAITTNPIQYNPTRYKTIQCYDTYNSIFHAVQFSQNDCIADSTTNSTLNHSSKISLSIPRVRRILLTTAALQQCNCPTVGNSLPSLLSKRWQWWDNRLRE